VRGRDRYVELVRCERSDAGERRGASTVSMQVFAALAEDDPGYVRRRS
jgi:hypothetical protein